MKKSIVLFIALLFAAVGCGPEEDPLGEMNLRPFFSLKNSSYYDYYLLEPWGYRMRANKNKSYPLLIYLHGSGGAWNIGYLSHLGYDDDDGNANSTAVSFQSNYRCFVMLPQTDGYWNSTSLSSLTEEVIGKYRIDRLHLYLIGYSMGGSGSYSFINTYYDRTGRLFNGVIRLAGQSQTSVRDAIAAHTKIWLHIGLDDIAVRVQVTRDAYGFLRDFHGITTESTNSVPIDGYTGATYTLMLSNRKMFRRTEYTNVGHGVSSFPFRDPEVMRWLFEE